MGFKKFITKQALRLKGMKGADAERIADELDKNPELAESLKSLNANKEVSDLMKKIQSEIEEKKKSGMNEMYASVMVMGKYKSEIAKHKDALEPLMHLMQR